MRTLGGVVGKIGQSVAGEARIGPGTRSLLFLAEAGGALVVTARAQGHYPLVTDKGAARLAASPDPGLLLPRRGPRLSAQERLVGATLEEALGAIQQIRSTRDEK